MANTYVTKARHRLANMGKQAIAERICILSNGEYELGVLLGMSEVELTHILSGIKTKESLIDLSEAEREKDEGFNGSKHSGERRQ